MINAYDALPHSPPGGGTSGLAYLDDGTPYIDDMLRSGRDADAEDIFKYLNGLPEFEHWPGCVDPAGHVETKLAWKMRKMGKRGEEVHVAINKNFVCPRVNGPNDVGCK
ncbi:DddA-like double-stranded DNA deaminase toxin [Streptomyces sp. NPDC059743]|uniref:DddA-like double-stranded DNA deaminase toxin n=1 Tax=Streptomyces sp. NPDC059743 TaxID=3346928 RepID=UPI0036689197